MKTVILSDNPLFGEIVRQTASKCHPAEFVECTSKDEISLIHELHPEMIILDQALPVDRIDLILSQAYHLKKCRVLLVGLKDNEFVVVDSVKSTVTKVEDLLKAMTPELDEE
jgi:DNA-binding NarL/FixJ family response regulator